MLRARNLKAGAFLNAQCADVYPSVAKATVDAGWELVGHGWFQRSLKQSEDEEAEIKRCMARLEQLSGKKVRGWFGAGGGETKGTPDILKRCGIEFTHDWLVDDLPCWMTTAHGPMLCLPYTFELNDVPIWVVQNQSGEEMLRRLEASLARYAASPKATPGADRSTDTHDRVRTDKVDKAGCVTLRLAGRLHHIGIGRTHARTRVLVLVQDLEIRIINATTGELLRQLTLDTTMDYQPRGTPTGRPKKKPEP